MSQYTPDLVLSIARALQSDDAEHYTADAAHMLEDYAATLRQAARVDEDGLREAAQEALGLLRMLDPQHGVTQQLEAALSAQPAERQGEAVAYFSADPAEGEFNTYKTLAEAVAGAESLLESAQDDASDYGWQDEPPQICYGVVLGKCVELEGSRRPAPEGSEFTSLVDYRLTEPTHPAAPVGVPDMVGEASAMPGTSGFTMACFKAVDVPIGTKLYVINRPVNYLAAAAPSAPQGGER